jgi:hypothetical protein
MENNFWEKFHSQIGFKSIIRFYLGSTLTEKGGIVTEIEQRINLGYYKFNDLKKSIWNQSAINLKNLPGNSVVNGTIRS